MFTPLRQEARAPTRLQAEYGGGRDTENQTECTGDTQGRLSATGSIKLHAKTHYGRYKCLEIMKTTSTGTSATAATALPVS